MRATTCTWFPLGVAGTDDYVAVDVAFYSILQFKRCSQPARLAIVLLDSIIVNVVDELIHPLSCIAVTVAEFIEYAATLICRFGFSYTR